MTEPQKDWPVVIIQWKDERYVLLDGTQSTDFLDCERYIPESALLSDEAVEDGAKAAHELFGIYPWEETDPQAQATNRKAVRAVLRAAIKAASEQ